MDYIILESYSSISLTDEVQEFLKNRQGYVLWGSPYSDGRHHYQAVIKQNEKQILKD